MLTLKDDPPSTNSYGDGSEKKFSSMFKSFVDECLKKEPKNRCVVSPAMVCYPLAQICRIDKE